MRYWKVIPVSFLIIISSVNLWGQSDSTIPIVIDRSPHAQLHNVPEISLDPTPELIGQFPSPDNSPRGITFDGTHLWVAITGDWAAWNGPKIYKVDPYTGKKIDEYDHPGQLPYGLAWDGNYLWHSDHGTGMIYKLDPSDCSVIASFPAPQAKPGYPARPWDMTYYNGYLYVIVSPTKMIAKIDPANGQVVDTLFCEYPGAYIPRGITVIKGSSDQLAVAEEGREGALTINIYDFELKRWIDQWVPRPATHVNGLAHDALTGQLWVSGFFTNRIYIFNVGSKEVIPLQLHSENYAYDHDESFWIDIHIGDEAEGVTDLRLMGFTLNYSPANAIQLVSPVATHIEAGPIWDGQVVKAQTIEPLVGAVSVDMVRTVAGPGISGQGVVARMKFVPTTEVVQNTQIYFSLSGYYARDITGGAILLTGKDCIVNIITSFEVWPGDANNDGIVNQTDILPIGLFWGSSGPARSGGSDVWESQLCNFWMPKIVTYVDCDGSGVIDGNDVSVIVANWRKTHPVITSTEKREIRNLPKLNIVNRGYSRSTDCYELDIYAESPDELRGMAMCISACTENEDLAVSFYNDQFWECEPDFVEMKHNDDGRLSLAVIKPESADSTGHHGHFTTLCIPSTSGRSIRVFIEEIFGLDAFGNTFPLADCDTTFLNKNGIEQESTVQEFFTGVQNYPNPFNPVTTITYHIPSQEHVKLIVFDLHGRIIRRLVNSVQEAGQHHFVWDATDDSGLRVSSGLYICKLTTGSFVSHAKLILTK